MADPLISSLTDRLATSATGYGAVIDDVLNIRTVTDTQNGAALNALCVVGIRIISNCTDPDCTCFVQVLGRLRPDVRIVPVKAEVI